MTLSVAQIILVYNELECMWKEMVLIQFVVLSRHFVRGNEQNPTVDVRAEVCIRVLPNTNHDIGCVA
jgi:hypothetical protein